jgi:hypothetical protein
MTKLICTSALKDVDVMARGRSCGLAKKWWPAVRRAPDEYHCPDGDPHILIALVELSEIRPELEA